MYETGAIRPDSSRTGKHLKEDLMGVGTYEAYIERMKKMNLSQGKEKIPIVKLICSGVIPRRRFLKRQHGNYTAESMVLQVILPASP